MGMFDGNPLATMVGFGTSAGSLAGSMYDTNATNQANEQMLAQQEAFSAAQVKQQEAYQTDMSNTAVQRHVADLEAAGLNPMLAGANQGMASTPSGGAASAPSSPSRVSNISGGINSAVGNAVALANAYQDVQNKQDQGQLIRDQASNQASQAANTAIDSAQKGLNLDVDSEYKRKISDATLAQIQAATANTAASTANLPKTGKLIEAQTSATGQSERESTNRTMATDFDNYRRQAEAKMWAENPWLAYLRPTQDFFNSASSISSKFGY